MAIASRDGRWQFFYLYVALAFHRGLTMARLPRRRRYRVGGTELPARRRADAEYEYMTPSPANTLDATAAASARFRYWHFRRMARLRRRLLDERKDAD